MSGTTLARHRSCFEARNWQTHTARIAWTAAWRCNGCIGNPTTRPRNNDRIGAPCKASASTRYKRPPAAMLGVGGHPRRRRKTRASAPVHAQTRGEKAREETGSTEDTCPPGGGPPPSFSQPGGGGPMPGPHVSPKPEQSAPPSPSSRKVSP